MIAAVSVLKELSVNLINDLKLANSDLDHPPSGPIAIFLSSFLFFKSVLPEISRPFVNLSKSNPGTNSISGIKGVPDCSIADTSHENILFSFIFVF